MVYNKWTKGNHLAIRTSIPMTVTSWYCRARGGLVPFEIRSRARLDPTPAGSFVTHFGKQVHWDGAKDEDAVLLIMGEGPATATEVEMAK